MRDIQHELLIHGIEAEHTRARCTRVALRPVLLIVLIAEYQAIPSLVVKSALVDLATFSSLPSSFVSSAVEA